MARKKLLSVALTIVLSAGTVFGNAPQLAQTVSANAKETATVTEDTDEKEVVEDAEQVDASSYGLCDKTKDGAILHAFCWSFNTIKENMKDIAEAGYTTVQTSPANACNDSHPQMKLYDPNQGTDYQGENGCWWWHYQPTDWSIGNYQLGTKEDYAAMCEEADKYGVKIITDVIPNHTTPDLQRVSKDLINAAGGKLYHDNGFKKIGNGDWSWGNRLACTTGMMGGLPDVNTENQGFQAYYLKYCNDLIDIGCDGFRYDTAKHIGVPSDPTDPSNTRGVNDFWDVATGKKEVNGVKLKNADDVFIYGEVLQGDNVPTQEYANYMFQTASDYGGSIRSAIGSNDFSVGKISNWCHSNPDRIVSWVESHDTYCNDHPSAWMSDWQIRACWAVITARKQSAPLFMSRPDGSNGSSKNYWGNNVLGAKGNDQFKHPEVAACNHFRNAMVGEDEYMSNPNGSGSLLAIERGNKGVVIVNLGSDASNIKLQKVADGTYTEEVSGKQVQVSGGTLNYTVKGGTVAVIYNPTAITKDPSVSVSKDTGTFTAPFDLKLTPVNATKATYSINGGDAVEFSKATTVKIGEGCDIGDKVTVKVTATGEGEPFEKTFTYTMAETPAYKCYLRVKKSDFTDGAPNLYLYDSADVALNGGWPGEAMKEEGDYYVFTSDTVEGGLAILSKGDWRSVPAMGTGATVSGCMEFDKATNKFSAFTLETKAPTTKAPTKEPEKTKTPATKEPTPTPSKGTKTPEPSKDTKTPEPTQNTAMISVSLEDDSAFTTETEKVKITLNGATEGSYSVDGGPEQSFKTSTTAVLGQGKIADSDVILKVTAQTGKKTQRKTFTYHKVFDGDKANVKTSALRKMQNLFEVVADAAQTDAAAESGGMYATNPSGVGKEATITIDGSFSDWSEDMLIAQCGAWDIANAWKGGHENCVLDCYSLYGACDDKNLYIGWQMVNTTDTWARSGDGPLSDGGRVLDVPLIVALNVGTAQKMTGGTLDGKGIWGADVTFDTRVDHLLYMSGKPGLGSPGIFKAAGADGLVDYEKPEKTEEPKPTSNPGSKFTVNFGADRSSPQLNTTNLTLKAVAYGGEKGYKYEFMVDGETVQEASTKSSYNWAPKKGEHTIKVVVEDADGTKISSEKEYVIEGEDVVEETAEPTKPAKTPTPTESTNTAEPTQTPEEQKDILARIRFSASSPQKLGKSIGLELIAEGGTAPYKYTLVITDQSGKPYRILSNSENSKVVWKPTKAGKYKIYARIVDANGDYAVKNATYTINAAKKNPVSKITVKTFKANKYSVKKGKTVTFAMKATSSNKGKVQYKLLVQKKGTAKKSVIRKYATKTSYTWKAKNKGKYTVYLVVKDAKGKTTTKKLKKQITVK